MSKQIFITGGSGYIGSVVIEQAVAQGYSVHALSRTASSDTKLAQLGAVPVRGDLTSLDVLERESAAASAGVVHLAFANAGNYDMPYDEVLRINAAALDAVAAGLRQAPSSPPLIFTCGSLVAAPDPHGGETTEETPYDSNPLNDFHMAEAHALSLLPRPRVCSVRLAPWVYGRGGSGVLLLLNLAASAGRVLCIDDGQIYTSSVHVEDAARLYLLLLAERNASGPYNATTSHYVTMRQLADGVAGLLDLPVASLSVEQATAATGSAFIARFLSSPNKASSAKAARDVVWHPREADILDEIRSGSYPAVAEALKK